MNNKQVTWDDLPRSSLKPVNPWTLASMSRAQLRAWCQKEFEKATGGPYPALRFGRAHSPGVEGCFVEPSPFVFPNKVRFKEAA